MRGSASGRSPGACRKWARRKRRPYGSGEADFGEGGGEFDVVGVVALDFEEAGAAAEFAVEFVHEEVNGFVKVVGGDGDDEFGAGEDDVAFGDEFAGVVLGGGVFEFDAEAVEAGFVFEEAFHLGVDGVFEGFGELEVDAGEDQVVVAHV